MLNQLYSLSLKQTQPQKETTRKDKCEGCEKEYPINDLRNHVKYCFLSIEFPESDEEHYELPDPFGEENITNLYDIQMDKKVYKLHLMLHLKCSCRRLPNIEVTGYHQLPLFLCSHKTEVTGYMYHQMPLFCAVIRH